MKVMHAYVDSFNFEKMGFGEAIRFFLRGFRLPGEAQKIDRIMEKFAERYCKCNPNSFTSADTAYVLAYSVIMLNTDAHNSMVKDKMTKADFIRNNRGIDDGKDLPEDYLGALYDQIVKNEIKMNAELSAPQSKQGNSLNKLLGFDGILNLVWKQTEEKPLGANSNLIRHIQEEFKAKSSKSEVVYYAVADPTILRFMVEVCWGPMIAAFSVTLDQSDDKEATAQCLQGFRHAVHVTAMMGMQTQRDAFVTTMAKFTYLHCAADMKQKNVDAVKVFTAAAADERKSIVLLAFQTMEKIVREYFPYITETEALTFTDCVKCLITFTNSKFNSDVSLNAIAFLRFCAVKLADDGLACNEKSKGDDSCSQVVKDNALDGQMYIDKDNQMYFWVPLLSGLSKLTWDPRSAIRKSALEVLFNILKDHGHLFPQPFWAYVFNCAIFPIFTVDSKEARKEDSGSLNSRPMHPDGSLWDSVTSVVAAECLIDLFIHFFDLIRAQLHGVVSILVEFVISPGQGPSSAGVAALMRLAADLRGKLLEDEWLDIFLCLKEAAGSNLSGFAKLLKTIDGIEMPHVARPDDDIESTSGRGLTDDGSEDDNLQTVAYVVSRMKVHIAVQLLIIQVATDLYKMHQQSLPVNIVTVLLEIYSLTASHSNKLNSQTTLLHKLEKICSSLEISDPPLVHFENESYRNYINFLHDLLVNSPTMSEEKNVEAELVSVCEKVLRIYLECSGHGYASQKAIHKSRIHCYLPLGSAKKEELAARAPLVLTVMQTLGSLGRDIFRRRVLQLFPLFVDLVRNNYERAVTCPSPPKDDAKNRDVGLVES
ncbi:UNVERIFIED_CONTAM: Brefeldin A-inhibited guanine nucleotide-exchange protein 1 [Sesamum calycinum]|uniref:Brefeldin A-inhibited guanine nucleotide-exchange protein 1 n=1 Tax=Sesamum calycinum TaxID=2727403 RepID=A0AAW2R7Y9_9LAMI